MNPLNNNIDLLKKGYLDLEIDKTVNLREEIKKLRRRKNAVILAHYYQEPEIQDIADIIGDSLYLSQKASETDADIIVFCGVHFMAETAKIICPEKKVLIPDLNAGCSLSDSCKAVDFKEFLKDYPGYKVISYINTSAEIKALSDIICTSSNAVKIVESFEKDEHIIFAPDKNLGNYINSITGRNMVIWNGACHVHEQFSLERILKIKELHSDAKIIAHPECVKQVLLIADYIGSTSALLNYTKENSSTKFIVATESGIIHQMKKSCPHKMFIPAPPSDTSCACNDCNFMKLNTMKKLFLCLKHELPEIIINEEIRSKAEYSIKRMLELSK